MNLEDAVTFWQVYLKEYTFALAIVLAFYVLSRIFSSYISKLLLHLAKKSASDYDNKLVLAFKRPLTLLLVFTGFYLAGILYLVKSPAHVLFLNRLYRSAIIVFIAQGFYNLAGSTSGLLMRIGSAYELDKLFLSLLSKAIRAVIIAIGFTVLVQEWGYNISGFVAGLGLGGLAFALAAQDTAANLIGGIVILTEKPFTIGDWIVAEEVEGNVEDITFRSTKIRTFAQALVTVPNSSLAKAPITNWTRMGRRRINFDLGIPYGTSRSKLEQCIIRIREMLTAHPEIHPETISARFEKFGEYSLIINIYCFTNTTVWAEWLAVREDILYKIMDILDLEGIQAAIPSRTIHIDHNKSTAGE